jgi:hypothetical protein
LGVFLLAFPCELVTDEVGGAVECGEGGADLGMARAVGLPIWPFPRRGEGVVFLGGDGEDDAAVIGEVDTEKAGGGNL